MSRFALITTLGVVLVWGGAAHSQEPNKVETAEAKSRAKEHFKRAEVHYNVGDFTEALSEYRQAYLLHPHPAFLFNMAQCHRHLGNLEQAVFLLRRFISASPGEAEQRQAERLLQQVKSEIEAKKTKDKAIAAAKNETSPRDSAASSKSSGGRSVTQSAAPVSSAASRLSTPTLTDKAVSTSNSDPLLITSNNEMTKVKERTSPPYYKRWWFWTLVGSSAIAVITSVSLVAAQGGDNLPQGSLSTVDFR